MVIDNFFPESLINLVSIESDEYSWTFGRSDSNQDFYWTKVIYGDYLHAVTKKFETKFQSENVRACWEYFKEKTKCGVTDENLESVYFNGLTYGVEAHAHVDSNAEDYVTVICYICTDWNSHWGGETVFFDSNFSKNPADQIFYTHEITASVLPKYNRIVVFKGNTVHAVRPLSKSFRGLRKTMMFKIKNKNIKEFMGLCS